MKTGRYDTKSSPQDIFLWLELKLREYVARDLDTVVKGVKNKNIEKLTYLGGTASCTDFWLNKKQNRIKIIIQ